MILDTTVQGLFAWTGAFIVRSFAPFAAGSGISEIKVGLAGFRMRGFMSSATLLIKSVTLVRFSSGPLSPTPNLPLM